MNIKKLISTLFVTIIGFISKVYAVSARTLGRTRETAHDRTQVDGNRSVLDIISFVNRYLWFAIGFCCFLFMIINGYKLITAHGDEKQTKEAIKSLLGALIGIAICLLAYIIVRIAVNLFA